MGNFGILSDHKLAHVPGTVLLDDINHTEAATGLKHGTGKYSHIVLAPQPSDDPNDPLNWPLWRKDLCLFTAALGCLLFVAVLVPMLTPATYALSLEFNTSITAIVQLTGYTLLCPASFGAFVSAMSRVWGKRPQFLLASFFGVIGTIVCETAPNYNTLLAGRLVCGLAIAAYESLIVSIIGDMYFVHQRGARVTMFQLVSNSFSVISPIIAGVIYQNLGWRYMFHVAQPFLICQFIMVILFVPETAYNRNAIYNIDTLSTERIDELRETVKAGGAATTTEQPEMMDEKLAGSNRSSPVVRPTPAPKTFFQRMAVFNGRFTTQNPVKLFIAPFLLLANPAAIWGCLTQGISSAWWVTTAFVLAQIWGPPPYNLSTASVGYLYTGPAIGGFLGVLFMVLASDPLSRFFARRNGGVYEPEFRIYPMVFAVITGCISLFLLGNMIQQGKGYYVGSALHGFYGFSINVAGAVMNSYTVDAYRDESTEMLIIAMIFKNFFFYASSYFANNWLASAGPAKYFDIQGGIVLVIYATSVPMYVFGKRVRSWWRRHDLLKKMGIEGSGGEKGL